MSTKSIITNNYDTCFAHGCYKRPVNEHHLIFRAKLRPVSDRYGLVVPLCGEHHRWCHELSWKYPVFAESMKMLGQLAFERVHGNEDEFRKIFGKNYLDDELRKMTQHVSFEHMQKVIQQFIIQNTQEQKVRWM